MTELVFRPLAEDDLAAWLALENAAFSDPWSESQLQGWLSRERTLLMGAFDVENRQLQAFVLYSHVLDEAELLQIAVAHSARGKGLAARLMQQAGLQLKNLGIERIMLEVRDSNTPARSCYVRYGFGEDGIRKGYYKAAQGREDAVLMSYSLSP